MDKEREDKEMIAKDQTQKTTTANNDTVIMLAKKGSKKYRKMLDKLAKN